MKRTLKPNEYQQSSIQDIKVSFRWEEGVLLHGDNSFRKKTGGALQVLYTSCFAIRLRAQAHGG